MKRGAELPISVIVIGVIALVVLISILLFYTSIYNKASSTTENVVVPIVNKTNKTSQIIKNISYSFIL